MFKDEKGRRRFIRHPAEIPIEVFPATETEYSAPENVHKLENFSRNVSSGGLAFESKQELSIGSVIRVRILIHPAFDLTGRVVWCVPKEDYFYVGIEFEKKTDASIEDMVEEVCQVEMYKEILVDIVTELINSDPESGTSP